VLTGEEIAGELGRTFGGFEAAGLPPGTDWVRGKVRDIIRLPGELIISTTDRISAFDRVLGELPFKGEILNTLSLHWFALTGDILPNHILESLSPRTVRVRRCRVLPVEVVVRGYLSGSAWRDYEAGREISGLRLPPGLKENQKLPQPLITPSTKEDQGHDRPLSVEEILRTGLVEGKVWAQVERAALALFERGTRELAPRNLLLADTKYEFGLYQGELILADEIHTPDSSRFWFADSYPGLFEASRPPQGIDKEYLRRWLMEAGFMGNGPVPFIPPEVWIETARRYLQAYELLTGGPFIPHGAGKEEEAAVLRAAL
jgi:phosphoribosylaminoimidazole-succinocarboxamide synthase